MKNIIKVISVAIVLTLTACGGSSNSGGQSGGIEDGVYNGERSETVTFSSGGSQAVSQIPSIRLNVESGLIELEVVQNGQVSGRSSRSNITNGEFSVDLDRDFTVSDTTCDGTVTYTGTITSNSASGTADGTLDCTDNQGPFQQFISGTFSATRG